MRLTVARLFAVAALLAGVAFAPNASAGIFTYSDEATFLAENPGLNLELFDNNFSTPTTSESYTGFTASGPSLVSRTGTRFTLSGRSLTTSGLGSTDLAFTFDSAISAFGVTVLDTGTISGNYTLTVTSTTTEGNVSEDLVMVPPVQSTGNQVFFGFVTTAGSFTQVNFGGARDGDIVAFDNLHFGQTQVPEPATLAILGLGAVGVVGGRMRNRKRKNDQTA